MTSVYTPNIALEEPARGDYANTWDVPVNANMTLIDLVVAGRTTVALSSSPVTLNQTQANNKLIIFTGTLSANVTVSFPQIGGNFVIYNNTTGNYTVTVNTTAGGSLGVNLPQGLRTSIVLDGTDANYADEHSVPPGTNFPFSGLTAPAGFFLMYGQTVSRTTYPGLFSAITLTLTGNTVSGSNTINTTSLNLTTYPIIGAYIEGSNIPLGTTILSVTSSTIVMSANATGSASTVAIRLLPWGQGNGSTTFGIPDYRGRVPAGIDNMGGSAAGRLSGYVNAGIGLGAQTHTLITNEMPVHKHTLTDPTHTHSVNDPSHAHTVEGSIGSVGGPAFGTGVAGTATVVTSNSYTGININVALTGISMANTGGGAAHNNVQPTIMSNWIIKY